MKPKLTNDDFCRAAKKLRCDVAAIKAVAEVESKGKAFYDDGFPVILFERHKFRKFTGGQFTDKYPEVSGPAGNYGAGGQHQRDKFNLAYKLDPTAAMKSCSWGMFQIMGFNHEACGYKTVNDFVDAMKESEAKQLDAFVNFLIHEHLADELREHKWTPLAEGYNGEGYKQNDYHIKLPAAYKKYSKENIDCSQVSAALPAPSVPATSEQGNGSSESQSTPPNDHKEVKAEITPDGGVKMSSTEGPPAPKERIAVVKAPPKRWYQAVGAKVTTFISSNVFFQWVWAQVEKIADLKVPIEIWYGVSAIVFIGSCLWLLDAIIDNHKDNNVQKEIDKLLVSQNSTPDNLVQLIPPNEVDLYRARGFKIITRGDATGVSQKPPPPAPEQQ